MTEPNLVWDFGTGYDFFISLYILHKPDEFGLRPSWAAGVRSRIPAEAREVLEQAHAAVSFPMCWVYALPECRDSASVLKALRKLPSAERLPRLAKSSGIPDEAMVILEEVADRGTWAVRDRDHFREIFKEHKPPPPAKKLKTLLSIWADLESFGERYLSSLQAYRDVFFAEEEYRIQPALENALSEAKMLAAQMDFARLIETISKGIRFKDGISVDELVLVPSYWISPLVVFNDLEGGRGLFIFGGRPDSDSLVPGAQVPDVMLRALKTLADPTRLRILRYLSQKTITPAELARKLRLRAPTVTHHLSALRLAGLVYLTLGEKNRKYYAARSEAISRTFTALEQFLTDQVDINSEE